MATMTFTGVIRSFSTNRDGRVHIGVSEANPGKAAESELHRVKTDFNPKGPGQPFAARETPCDMSPDYGLYRFELPKERAGEFSYGQFVTVTVEVFNIMHVRWFSKSWRGFDNLDFDLVKIEPDMSAGLSAASMSAATTGSAASASESKPNKSR